MGRAVGCISFAILSLAFVFSGQSQGDDGRRVVATVGSTTIEAEVFRTRYIDHLLKTGLDDTPVRRAAFLNGLVAKRLLVLNAEDRGISEESRYHEEREAVSEKLLVEAYARQVIYRTVAVSRQDLEDMFVRANTQLTARHLYARTYREAEALLSRLNAGEDFEVLAAEIFADSVLARNGGLVGPFTFDEMDPAFEDAAFGLAPGETSAPVRTATGYSIIRLVDRFEKPILSEIEFAERKDRLESYVRHRKQRAARSKHLQELVQESTIRFADPTLDRLLAQITGQLLIPDEEEMASWVRQPLLSYRDGENQVSWTVEDFRERAWRTDKDQRAQVKTRDDLIEFASGLVARDVIIGRALSLGFDQSPAFDKAHRDAMEEWTYAQALEELRMSMPAGTGDEQSYLRSQVLVLRETYPVHIDGDVLTELPLIENESF